MKLKDIVVSVELSKKLKEIGINQESVYKFYSNNGTEYKLKASKDSKNYLVNFSAFTLKELRDLLPYGFTYRHTFYHLNIGKTYGGYMSQNYTFEECFFYQDEKIEDSLAKVLIWLKENEYI